MTVVLLIFNIDVSENLQKGKNKGMINVAAIQIMIFKGVPTFYQTAFKNGRTDHKHTAQRQRRWVIESCKTFFWR